MQEKMETSTRSRVNPASRFSSAAGAASYIAQLSLRLFLHICTASAEAEQVPAPKSNAMCRFLHRVIPEELVKDDSNQSIPPQGNQWQREPGKCVSV